MPDPAPPGPPFRAEHIGSLLRPPELLAARGRLAAGEIDAAALAAIEDEAIRQAVALQESIGLEVLTDGEFRRGTYSDNFTTSGIGGVTADFSGGAEWTYTDRHGHQTAARVPRVIERLRWQGSTNRAAFEFLAGLTERTKKLTLPGPCYIHYRAGRANISADVYPDLDDFWSDLVACYASELAALAQAGCTYVQLDETSLAKLGDPKIRDGLARRGDDWQDLLGVYVEAINAVVAAAPPGMRLGLHLCRGNNQGHWQAEGGYDDIAMALFKRLSIDLYFLEYDSPRAGTLAPLAEVPAGKTVVLGLVSTKLAALEDEALLIGRIFEASSHVPLEALAISPQCGFASAAEGNPITPAEQEAKLRRVVAVAERVWRG